MGASGNTTTLRCSKRRAAGVLAALLVSVSAYPLHAEDYGYQGTGGSRYKVADSPYQKRKQTSGTIRSTAPYSERQQRPVRIAIPKEKPAPLLAPAPVEPASAPVAPAVATRSKPAENPDTALQLYEAPATPLGEPKPKIDPSLLAAPEPQIYEAPKAASVPRIPNALLSPPSPYDQHAKGVDSEEEIIEELPPTPVATPPALTAQVPTPAEPAVVEVDSGPEVKAVPAPTAASALPWAAPAPDAAEEAPIPEPVPVAVFEAPQSSEKLKIDPTLLDKTAIHSVDEDKTPVAQAEAPPPAPMQAPPAELNTPVADIGTEIDITPPSESRVFEKIDSGRRVGTTNPETAIFTPYDPDKAKKSSQEIAKAEVSEQPQDHTLNVPEVPVSTDTTPPVSEEDDVPVAMPEELSKESKEILASLPKGIGTPATKEPPAPISIDRARAVNDIFAETGTSKTHSDLGITIEVKEPNLNVNEVLEQAYNQLMAGDALTAINSYKKVLAAEPDNKLALFGLATTYHKERQFDLARPLYGHLLKLDPYDVEALSNFLALISEESPAEAISQLEKLQVENPDFSPIPAQIASIYQKMGDLEKAIEKMRQAARISPENLAYRYNLAILLDKYGSANEAASLYRGLLAAYEQGEKIPGSSKQIQERLTFLGSNRQNIN